MPAWRSLRSVVLISALGSGSAALCPQALRAQEPTDAWWKKPDKVQDAQPADAVAANGDQWWKPGPDEAPSAPEAGAELSEEALPWQPIAEDDAGNDPSGGPPAVPSADRERQEAVRSEEPDPSESAEEADCFRELRSIDYGLENSLDDHRFAHVWAS